MTEYENAEGWKIKGETVDHPEYFVSPTGEAYRRPNKRECVDAAIRTKHGLMKLVRDPKLDPRPAEVTT